MIRASDDPDVDGSSCFDLPCCSQSGRPSPVMFNFLKDSKFAFFVSSFLTLSVTLHYYLPLEPLSPAFKILLKEGL